MLFRRALTIVLAVAAVLAAAAPRPAARSGPVRVNEVQAIGTHNSYKREISEAEQEIYEAAIQQPGDYDQFLAYSHAALPRQLGRQGCAGSNSTCSRIRPAGCTPSRSCARPPGSDRSPTPRGSSRAQGLHIADLDYKRRACGW